MIKRIRMVLDDGTEIEVFNEGNKITLRNKNTGGLLVKPVVSNVIEIMSDPR